MKKTLDNIDFTLPRFQSTYDKKIKVRENNDSKSLTHQSFKDETLIQNILHKNKLIGNDLFAKQFDFNNDNIIDITEIPDFHQYQTKLVQAQQSFMRLDPRLRAEFNNNPQTMLAFLADPKNHQKAVELGLMKAREVNNDNPLNNNFQNNEKNDNLRYNDASIAQPVSNVSN